MNLQIDSKSTDRYVMIFKNAFQHFYQRAYLKKNLCQLFIIKKIIASHCSDLPELSFSASCTAY